MAIHISRFNPEHGRPLSPFAGGNQTKQGQSESKNSPVEPFIFLCFFLEIHRSTFESIYCTSISITKQTQR